METYTTSTLGNNTRSGSGIPWLGPGDIPGMRSCLLNFVSGSGGSVYFPTQVYFLRSRRGKLLAYVS